MTVSSYVILDLDPKFSSGSPAEGTIVIEAMGNGVDAMQYNFGFYGFSTNFLYQQFPEGNYHLTAQRFLVHLVLRQIPSKKTIFKV